MQRRSFLKGLGCTSVLLGVEFSAFAAPTPARTVLIVLRGGMDGLAAVPAIGDSAFRSIRGDAEATDLGEGFGLHPKLESFKRIHEEGHLLTLHGVASPYRGRSHFDAQKIMENGTSRASHGIGWLNRAASHLEGLPMAFGSDVPLVLRGPEPHTSINPRRRHDRRRGFAAQVAALYEDDSLFYQTYQRAQWTLDQLSKGGQLAPQTPSAQRIGTMMASAQGPRIAVMQMGGWDTHTGQASRHRRLFQDLSNQVDLLRRGLGATWSHTTVVIASEFGRTVRPNGTGGTDHGTAGVAWVLGGSVRGRVLAPDFDLKRLHQDRDLRPTLDLRSVFKGVLSEQHGLSTTALNQVFPDSTGVPPLSILA